LTCIIRFTIANGIKTISDAVVARLLITSIEIVEDGHLRDTEPGARK
jgi:hypothetical protein